MPVPVVVADEPFNGANPHPARAVANAPVGPDRGEVACRHYRSSVQAGVSGG